MSERVRQGTKPIEEEELVAVEPTREEKIEARVTELCDVNTRRGLEVIAREMGFEPTRTEFPDKVSLATAIAEKEFPEEEEVTEEAPTEEEAEPT